MVDNDYNIYLTILPPAPPPPRLLRLSVSLSVNLFTERESKLTKFQMAMAEASEQGNKLRGRKKQKETTPNTAVLICIFI